MSSNFNQGEFNLGAVWKHVYSLGLVGTVRVDEAPGEADGVSVIRTL
jgi:hypothetical protein